MWTMIFTPNKLIEPVQREGWQRREGGVIVYSKVLSSYLWVFYLGVLLGVKTKKLTEKLIMKLAKKQILKLIKEM